MNKRNSSKPTRSPGGPREGAKQLRGVKPGSPRRDEVALQGANPRGPHAHAPQAHGASEWWKEVFDERWGRLGLESIEPEQTKREVDFLVDVLELKLDSKVLDLACGMGRHALELARRGFAHVTGLDLTGLYIENARLEAKNEGLNVEFVQADMRDIPFNEELDAVYNFYTSFGFFESDKENEKVIGGVVRALKPGGRFLMDIVNRDWIVRNFQRRGWSEYEGDYVLAEREFDLRTSYATATWIFIDKGKKIERRISHRIYSLHELVDLFERNRLKFKEAWGNLDAEPLTWNHKMQKLLAVKG